MRNAEDFGLLSVQHANVDRDVLLSHIEDDVRLFLPTGEIVRDFASLELWRLLLFRGGWNFGSRLLINLQIDARIVVPTAVLHLIDLIVQ